MNQPRIGAYGGTFDPIHNGHTEVARAVARNFKLDRLLIIPAHRPPHKNRSAISDAYHRYAMTVLATLEEPRVIVSMMEMEEPARPYSFQTVERLREIYGAQAQLFFVIGADSFEEINTWREPARLLSETNLVVVTRPGYDVKSSHLAEEFRARVIDLRWANAFELASNEKAGASGLRIYLTDYVNEDISSTGIRQLAREGRSVNGLVSPRVAGYIEKYELYRR